MSVSPRVLMVTASDSYGGASRAALRLHRGLLDAGVDSHVLVAERKVRDPHVMAPGFPLGRVLWSIIPRIDTLPKRFYPGRNREVVFYPGLVGGISAGSVGRHGAQLVHLHWTLRGLISIGAIGRIGTPVVWTLHDSWAFTGGCHIPFDCLRYRESCGACPELGSAAERDLSRRVWERKRLAWEKADITLVAPSCWMARCASSSSLFSRRTVLTIPNGLDTGVYRPRDKAQARRRIGLPEDKVVILFGGHRCLRDRNKGAHLLAEALARTELSFLRERVELVVFGDDMNPSATGFRLPTRSAGYLGDDETLATYYCAADLFVAPSVQENLPNTVMESMACGTPCVAFDIGGIPDMVEHRKNGYLARPGDTADLAAGIAWVLADTERGRTLAFLSRRKAEAEWSLPVVARRYLDLYRETISSRGKRDDVSGPPVRAQ